ncbi:hypothetical protein MASR2M48_25380 [Spirochaetota bacterium]
MTLRVVDEIGAFRRAESEPESIATLGSEPDEYTCNTTIIKVIGAGGGGSNAVNRMIEADYATSTSSSPIPTCRRSGAPMHAPS